MPRRRYIFDPPERFVAGTVGEPGDRTFFLQARDGGRVVSIVLEKVQVAVLAERLGDLLDELERRGVEGVEPRPPARGRHGPLDEPLVEAFRAGSLTLGWDGGAERVLVEARAQDEDGEAVDPDEDDDEDEDGPDLLRVRITAAAARAFIDRAEQRRRPAAGCPARCAARRSIRAGTSARAATATTSTSAERTDPMLDRATTLEVLRDGRASRSSGASSSRRNNALFVRVTRPCPEPGAGPVVLEAIYKPTVGERPLDDFPDGTLAQREVAAWLVSEAIGWDIVPPTILRDGPFGEGMLQAFVEPDAEVDVVAMVVEDDPRLRRMAVFDAAVNNTDRKGGHILPVDGGRHIHGVDHGVTFSAVPKLRTVLWGWRGEPFDDGRAAPGWSGCGDGLDEDPCSAPSCGRCSARPRSGPCPAGRRAAGGRAASRYPSPTWPAVPWPPF